MASTEVKAVAVARRKSAARFKRKKIDCKRGLHVYMRVETRPGLVVYQCVECAEIRSYAGEARP